MIKNSSWWVKETLGAKKEGREFYHSTNEKARARPDSTASSPPQSEDPEEEELELSGVLP